MGSRLFHVVIRFALVESPWTYNGMVHLCVKDSVYRESAVCGFAELYHKHIQHDIRMTFMTSQIGNIFRVTSHLWSESTGQRWIPFTKVSDAQLWFFFVLHLNKWLSKHSRHRWFETRSCWLWRHCNAICLYTHGEQNAQYDHTASNHLTNIFYN